MVNIDRIIESNEKLNFLSSEEKKILYKLDEIATKSGFWIEEYNAFVRKKITSSLKNIMLDDVWNKKYDNTYITHDKKAKNFLGSFEKIQYNPDCIPIRVYFDW